MLELKNLKIFVIIYIESLKRFSKQSSSTFIQAKTSKSETFAPIKTDDDKNGGVVQQAETR